MGVSFLYKFSSEKREQISVYGGIKKSWGRCRFCRKKINKQSLAVGIHSFGETPSYYHPECAIKLAELISTITVGLLGISKTSLDRFNRIMMYASKHSCSFENAYEILAGKEIIENL
jgi:hypothetical protein